jgi:hypothetical protein
VALLVPPARVYPEACAGELQPVLTRHEPPSQHPGSLRYMGSYRSKQTHLSAKPCTILTIEIIFCWSVCQRHVQMMIYLGRLNPSTVPDLLFTVFLFLPASIP